VAEICPETEIQAFCDELAAAQSYHPGIRHSFILVFDHGSALSQASAGI
jgi:hypothetical protein